MKISLECSLNSIFIKFKLSGGLRTLKYRERIIRRIKASRIKKMKDYKKDYRIYRHREERIVRRIKESTDIEKEGL